MSEIYRNIDNWIMHLSLPSFFFLYNISEGLLDTLEIFFTAPLYSYVKEIALFSLTLLTHHVIYGGSLCAGIKFHYTVTIAKRFMFMTRLIESKNRKAALTNFLKIFKYLKLFHVIFKIKFKQSPSLC